MTAGRESFDVGIVGAGIVGLAHALACVRRGLRVVVIDRDAQANGASVRNFGFVTVSGQEPGAMWRRARRSRDVWCEVAEAAGIPVHQRGFLAVARSPEAAALLEEFAASETGQGCTLLSGRDAEARFPSLAPGIAAALSSPHEIRVEPVDAIGRLASHLEAEHGVVIRRGETVRTVEPGLIHTARSNLHVDAAIVAAGDDFATLFPEALAAFGLQRCKLQMMRVRPSRPPLPHVLMSDLSLVRYAGFATLRAAGSLRARLEREAAPELAAGIHLIVAGSADGTSVIGDSHVYAATPDPFADETVDERILAAYATLMGERPTVLARWTGTYASSASQPVVIAAPHPQVRVVTVATGAGMSCAFALAEEVVADLLGAAAPC